MTFLSVMMRMHLFECGNAEDVGNVEMVSISLVPKILSSNFN
jgi:hypothetical protein